MLYYTNQYLKERPEFRPSYNVKVTETYIAGTGWNNTYKVLKPSYTIQLDSSQLIFADSPIGWQICIQKDVVDKIISKGPDHIDFYLLKD